MIVHIQFFSLYFLLDVNKFVFHFSIVNNNNYLLKRKYTLKFEEKLICMWIPKGTQLCPLDFHRIEKKKKQI